MRVIIFDNKKERKERKKKKKKKKNPTISKKISFGLIKKKKTPPPPPKKKHHFLHLFQRLKLKDSLNLRPPPFINQKGEEEEGKIHKKGKKPFLFFNFSQFDKKFTTSFTFPSCCYPHGTRTTVSWAHTWFREEGDGFFVARETHGFI